MGDGAKLLCLCGPGAIPWIRQYFEDCIYTPWEYAAFAIGLSSVLFWLVAQLPQLISNWRNKSADALSPWFLFEWLSGDTCNLLGCLLSGNQLATQTFTALYFIFADACIISQYVYYQILNSATVNPDEEAPPFPHKIAPPPAAYGALAIGIPRHSTSTPKSGTPHSHNWRGGLPGKGTLFCVAGLALLGLASYQQDPLPQFSLAPLHRPGRVLTSFDGGLAVSQGGLDETLLLQGGRARNCGENDKEMWVQSVGMALGWVSSVFYLASRVSQILKNWRRRSVEGLSLMMFGCAVMGNCTYAAAILMRATSWHDIVAKFPWILGSLGTVSLDATIFIQAHYYAPHKHPNGERTPLLGPTIHGHSV